MNTITKRLLPGDDLFEEILSLTEDSKIKSGVVLSLVGSLEIARIRLAGQDDASTFNGPFEITSSTGTVGQGTLHVHIAVSDEKGVTFGGHLMPGSKVYTTVELVVLDLSSQWIFERKHCQLSGFNEMAPVKVKAKG